MTKQTYTFKLVSVFALLISLLLFHLNGAKFIVLLPAQMIFCSG